MSKKELICIGCPLGCNLVVDFDDEKKEVLSVSGNTCMEEFLGKVSEFNADGTTKVWGTVVPGWDQWYFETFFLNNGVNIVNPDGVSTDLGGKLSLDTTKAMGKWMDKGYAYFAVGKDASSIMMVDCGHPDAGKDVVKVLKALGIDHIDIFVNSHPHIDHLGAFPQIAQVCSIGQVYRSLVEYDTSYTRNFASTIEKKGIPVQMLAEGDGFLFGENVRVDVLWPEKGPVEYPKNYPGNGATQFLNDHSLALQLTFGESKLLLCGDLYRAGERAVLDGHGLSVTLTRL